MGRMIRRVIPVLAFAALATWPGLSVRTGLAAQERAARVDSVSVAGFVVDHETGDSISDATVSLDAGPHGAQARGTRLTNDDGRFHFRGVPEGTYRLVVHATGFQDMRDTLQVSGSRDMEVMLPLSEGSVHGPVIESAGFSPRAQPGYERRRAGGARFLITREEILEKRPRRISELLHRVPGGMVVPAPPYGYTLLLRNQCRPGIWMDGVESYGGTIDRLVSPMDVEAVEVYHGFELPVEFGVNSCGGILVWTRWGPPPAPALEEGEGASGMGVLGGLLKAVAVIAVVVIIVTR